MIFSKAVFNCSFIVLLVLYPCQSTTKNYRPVNFTLSYIFFLISKTRSNSWSNIFIWVSCCKRLTKNSQKFSFKIKPKVKIANIEEQVTFLLYDLEWLFLLLMTLYQLISEFKSQLKNIIYSFLKILNLSLNLLYIKWYIGIWQIYLWGIVKVGDHKSLKRTLILEDWCHSDQSEGKWLWLVAH